MTVPASSMPKDMNLRQLIEGMPMVFNARVAGDLYAVIQFNVSGKEPGRYYLTIDSGDCSFHTGTATSPTLTITTPSEVWLKISRGEITGQEALLKGLYKAEGDAAVLLKMGDMFNANEDFSIYDSSRPVAGQYFKVFKCKSGSEDEKAPAGSRPAGPLPISSMGWMTIFFVIWTIFWICFDIRSISPWIGSGVPLALMTAVIVYRSVYNRPVWAETASWAFFVLAIVLAPVLELPLFLTWGSVIGSLFMAGMWLISLAPFIRLPLCAEYSKWGYIRKLWSNSMFIQPNLAISLAWGWQFVIASCCGIAARLVPELFIPFTTVRYLLIIPAALFTIYYQKGVLDRKLTDIDKNMSILRAWAYAGLAATAAILLVVWLALPASP